VDPAVESWPSHRRRDAPALRLRLLRRFVVVGREERSGSRRSVVAIPQKAGCSRPTTSAGICCCRAGGTKWIPRLGRCHPTKGGMLPPYDYDFYGDLLLWGRRSAAPPGGLPSGVSRRWVVAVHKRRDSPALRLRLLRRFVVVGREERSGSRRWVVAIPQKAGCSRPTTTTSAEICCCRAGGT